MGLWLVPAIGIGSYVVIFLVCITLAIILRRR